MAFLGCHLDQMDLPAQACDEDGKWWVSGYRLYAAGLIDDASTLLVELSAEQSKKMFGTPTPSAFDFMVHGLRCYADQLWTLIMVADVWAHHYFALGDPAGRASQLRWRAARWRREVIDWLAEHGIEDPPPRVGIVPRSQHNRLPKDVPASGEVIRLAGGVIELVDLAGLPDSVRRDVVRIQKGEGLGGLRKLLEGEDCDSAIN
jgi:hypothetical protein